MSQENAHRMDITLEGLREENKNLRAQNENLEHKIEKINKELIEKDLHLEKTALSEREEAQQKLR